MYVRGQGIRRMRLSSGDGSFVSPVWISVNSVGIFTLGMNVLSPCMGVSIIKSCPHPHLKLV